MRKLGKAEQQSWQFAIFLIILIVSTPFQAMPASAAEHPPPEKIDYNSNDVVWATVDLSQLKEPDLNANLQNVLAANRGNELKQGQIEAVDGEKNLNDLAKQLKSEEKLKFLKQKQIRQVTDKEAIKKIADALPKDRLIELKDTQIPSIEDKGVLEDIVETFPKTRLGELDKDQARKIEDPKNLNKLANQFPEDRLGELKKSQLEAVTDKKGIDRVFDNLDLDRVTDLSETQLEGALSRLKDLNTKSDRSVVALRKVHGNLEKPKKVEIKLIKGITYKDGKLINPNIGELDLSQINQKITSGTAFGFGGAKVRLITKIEATRDDDAYVHGFKIYKEDSVLSIQSYDADQIASIQLFPNGDAVVKTTFGQTLRLNQGEIRTLGAKIGTAIVTEEGTILNLDSLGIQINSHGNSRKEPTIIEFDHINKKIKIGGPHKIRSFDPNEEPDTGDFDLTNQGQSLTSITFDDKNRPINIRGEKIELNVYKKDENGIVHKDNVKGNVGVQLNEGQITGVAWKGKPEGNFYGIGDITSADGADKITFFELQTGEGKRGLAERPLTAGQGAAISKILQINQARAVFEQEILEKFKNKLPVTIPVYNEKLKKFDSVACTNPDACKTILDKNYKPKQIKELLKRLSETPIKPRAVQLLGEEIEITVPDRLKDSYHSKSTPIDIDKTQQNYLAVSRVLQGTEYIVGAVAKRGFVDIKTKQFTTKTESDSAFYSWTNLPRPDPDEKGTTTTDSYAHDYKDETAGIGSDDPNRFLVVEWNLDLKQTDKKGFEWKGLSHNGKGYKTRDRFLWGNQYYYTKTINGEQKFVDEKGVQVSDDVEFDIYFDGKKDTEVHLVIGDTSTLVADRDVAKEVITNGRAPVKRLVHTKSNGQTKLRVSISSALEQTIFNSKAGGKLQKGWDYTGTNVRHHFAAEPTEKQIKDKDFIANVVRIKPTTNKLDTAISIGYVKRPSQTVNDYIDADEREGLYQQIIPEIRTVERSLANPAILRKVIAPLRAKLAKGEISGEEFERQLSLLDIIREGPNKFSVSKDKGVLGYIAPEKLKAPVDTGEEVTPPSPIVTAIREALGKSTGLGKLVEAFQQSERGDSKAAITTIRSALALEGDDKLDLRTGVQSLVDETLKIDDTKKFENAEKIIEEFKATVDPKDTLTKAQLDLIKGGVISKDRAKGEARFDEAKKVIEQAKKDINGRIAQLLNQKGITDVQKKQLTQYKDSLNKQADQQIAGLIVSKLQESGKTVLTAEIKAELQKEVDAGNLQPQHIEQIEFTFQKNALQKALKDNNKEEITRLLTVLAPKTDKLDSSTLTVVAQAHQSVGSLDASEQFFRLAEETLAGEAADKGFRTDEGFNLGEFQKKSTNLLQQRIQLYVQQGGNQGSQPRAADIVPTAELFLAADLDETRGGQKNNQIRLLLAETYSHVDNRKESERVYDEVITSIKKAREEIAEESRESFKKEGGVIIEFDPKLNPELKLLQDQLVGALIGKASNAGKENEFEDQIALLGEAKSFSTDDKQGEQINGLIVNTRLKYANKLGEEGKFVEQRDQLSNAKRLLSDPAARKQIDTLIFQNRLDAAKKNKEAGNAQGQQTELKAAIELVKKAGIGDASLVTALQRQLLGSYIDRANLAKDTKDPDTQVTQLEAARILAGQIEGKDEKEKAQFEATRKQLTFKYLNALASKAANVADKGEFVYQKTLLDSLDAEAKIALDAGDITKKQLDSLDTKKLVRDAGKLLRLYRDPTNVADYNKFKSVREQLLLGNYAAAAELRRQGGLNAKLVDNLDLPEGLKQEFKESLLIIRKFEYIKKGIDHIRGLGGLAPGLEEKIKSQYADIQAAITKAKKFNYNREKREKEIRDATDPLSRSRLRLALDLDELSVKNDIVLSTGIPENERADSSKGLENTGTQSKILKVYSDVKYITALKDRDRLLKIPEAQRTRKQRLALSQARADISDKLFYSGLTEELNKNWKKILVPDSTKNPILNRANNEARFLAIQSLQKGDLFGHNIQYSEGLRSKSYKKLLGTEEEKKKFDSQQQRTQYYVEVISKLVNAYPEDHPRRKILENKLGVVAQDIKDSYKAAYEVTKKNIVSADEGELTRTQALRRHYQTKNGLEDTSRLAQIIGSGKLDKFFTNKEKEDLFEDFKTTVERYGNSIISERDVYYTEIDTDINIGAETIKSLVGYKSEYSSTRNLRASNSRDADKLKEIAKISLGTLALANYDITGKKQRGVYKDIARGLKQSDRLAAINEKLFKDGVGWYDPVTERLRGPQREKNRAYYAQERGVIYTQAIEGLDDKNKIFTNDATGIKKTLKQIELEKLQRDFKGANENRIYATNTLAQNQGSIGLGVAREEAQKLLDAEEQGGFHVLRAAITSLTQNKAGQLASDDARTNAEITRLESKSSRSPEEQKALQKARDKIISNSLERQQLRTTEFDIKRSTKAEERLKTAQAGTLTAHLGQTSFDLGKAYQEAGKPPYPGAENGFISRVRRTIGGYGGATISAASKYTFGTVIPVVTDAYGELVGNKLEGAGIVGDWASGVQSQRHKNEIAVTRALQADNNRETTFKVIQGLSEKSRNLRKSKQQVDDNIRTLITSIKKNKNINKDAYGRIISGARLIDDSRAALAKEIKNHKLPPEIEAELARRGISKEEFLRAALQTLTAADDNKDGGAYHEELTQDSLTELEKLTRQGRREAYENAEKVAEYTKREWEFGWSDILNPAGAAAKLGLRTRSLIFTSEYTEQKELQREATDFAKFTDGLVDSSRRLTDSNPDASFSDLLNRFDSNGRRTIITGSNQYSQTLGTLEIDSRLKAAGIYGTPLGNKLRQAQIEELNAGLSLGALSSADTKSFVRYAKATGQKEYAEYAEDLDLDYRAGQHIVEGTKEIGNAILFFGAFKIIGAGAEKVARGLRKLPGIRKFAKPLPPPLPPPPPQSFGKSIRQALEGHAQAQFTIRGLGRESIEEAIEELGGSIVQKAFDTSLGSDEFKGGGELGEAAVIFKDFAKTLILGPRKHARHVSPQRVKERQQKTQKSIINTALEQQGIDATIDTKIIIEGQDGPISLGDVDLNALADKLNKDKTLTEITIGINADTNKPIIISREALFVTQTKAQSEAERQLLLEEFKIAETKEDKSIIEANIKLNEIQYDASIKQLQFETFSKEIEGITPDSSNYAKVQNQFQEYAALNYEAQSRIIETSTDIATKEVRKLEKQLAGATSQGQVNQIDAAIARQETQLRQNEATKNQLELSSNFMDSFISARTRSTFSNLFSDCSRIFLISGSVVASICATI